MQMLMTLLEQVNLPAFLGALLLCLGYLPPLWRERRHPPSETSASRPCWGLVAFLTALAAMLAVLITPIDRLARSQLFVMHMLQVIVLSTLCAPLLLIAMPVALRRRLLSGRDHRQAGASAVLHFLTRPLPASILYNGFFLLWHLPSLYTVTCKQALLYDLALVILLLTALLNWWPLLGPTDAGQGLSYPAQMLYAFLDGQPIDIFAFLLVFSGAIFYPIYAQQAHPLLAPLSDQEAAGAMLLVPGLVDLLVITPLFFRWLAELERRARVRDQQLQQIREAAEQEKEPAASENWPAAASPGSPPSE
ncbi:cytochrome c oxidase assembly protein [Thermogemmatispora sp.]|uniref:cytochrome c oxidase assembly protein n=1 Tax=Thermogemmatispora sp. TaxID=1968838 RepID=UPI001D24B256|nr:cytochrome c oxidase assembly protein [Thermogemmatispora sp.]MBX5450232.1 cytochrome c oxidase assembly protein [Thermogemmatispora sp.]